RQSAPEARIGRRSRSATNLDIAVGVRQFKSAGTIADRAVQGIASHSSGRGDWQFARNVTERRARVDLVSATGGNANSDVGKGSLEVDVFAAGAGRRGDVDRPILVVDANRSADPFKRYAGERGIHGGVAFNGFCGHRTICVLRGDRAFYGF